MGHNLAELDNVWPMSAKIGPVWVTLALIRQIRPNFGKPWRMLGRLRPKSVQLGGAWWNWTRSWPTAGQTCPNSGRLWQCVANIWPNSNKICPTVANSGQIRAAVGPFLTNVGRQLAKSQLRRHLFDNLSRLLNKTPEHATCFRNIGVTSLPCHRRPLKGRRHRNDGAAGGCGSRPTVFP